MQDMGIEPGQRIGDYEVVKTIGVGGLGAVYEVRHLISQRAEAMKVLLPDQTGTPEMAERFRREIQLLASLSHPNIAALHNAFYHENRLIMIMELVQGETLRGSGLRVAIPLPRLLDFASQTLAALIYAHNLGIVHRDIKPSNIMITGGRLVKVLDFGIAISDHSPELTNTGFLLGSLNYMSPEQVMGSKATPRSDIYSLGVTLYETITGRLPITGSTNYEIMTGHLNQAPIPPVDLNPALPLAISQAILKALAKDPAARFATAQEFASALQLAAASGVNEIVTIPAEAQEHLRKRTTSSTVFGNVSPSGSEPLPLEEITKQLAVFLGPIAKIIIKKLATQCPNADQLYSEAAKQIPSELDRQKFLYSRRCK
jgi:eukaryotic-like serine/threonine-protein kinase